MVTLREILVGGSGAGERSGSCSGTEQLEERMREFVSVEITRGILYLTPMIFGTVKEGILEILDERLGAFHAEMMALIGVRTLTFWEFRACGAQDYHVARDLIASSRWLAMLPTLFIRASSPKGGRDQNRLLYSVGPSAGLVRGGWSCDW